MKLPRRIERTRVGVGRERRKGPETDEWERSEREIHGSQEAPGEAREGGEEENNG